MNWEFVNTGRAMGYCAFSGYYAEPSSFIHQMTSGNTQTLLPLLAYGF
jgi:hypothetical protein